MRANPDLPLDVIGVGNAIVDVIANVSDAFLTEHGLVKGAMTLIDTDRVSVEVEPPSAEIVIESFTHEGEPAAVFLGESLAEARVVPLALRRDSPELAIDRVDTLLPITREQSVVARPGLYLATVAPAGLGEDLGKVEDVTAALADITCPTTVIVGAADAPRHLVEGHGALVGLEQRAHGPRDHLQFHLRIG